jgi:hypothetical protein
MASRDDGLGRFDQATMGSAARFLAWGLRNLVPVFFSAAAMGLAATT